jgi:hypothetical protein
VLHDNNANTQGEIKHGGSTKPYKARPTPLSFSFTAAC